jgi:hypothetical protein
MAIDMSNHFLLLGPEISEPAYWLNW